MLTLGDTPDPGVVFDPATSLWWAATTGGSPGTGCFELNSSPDLGNTWTPRGLIFPPSAVPSWIADSCWAPELHRVGGQWMAVYVGRTAAGLLSVGVALSSTGNVSGPYFDPVGAPLITDAAGPTPQQGQIDATIVIDVDGTPYIVWKTDGNADGRPTPIRIAQLAGPNSTALLPFPSQQPDWHDTQLITNDLPFEGGIVEAPWVLSYAGAHFLFYSSNSYYDGTYAVSVARSTAGLRGPFEKLGHPILRNSTGTASPPFQSPGHCSVVQTQDGNWAMVYHAWVGSDRSARHLMVDRIVWVPDGEGGVWPQLASGGNAPGVGPQPLV